VSAPTRRSAFRQAVTLALSAALASAIAGCGDSGQRAARTQHNTHPGRPQALAVLMCPGRLGAPGPRRLRPSSSSLRRSAAW
jgi:hypothetical protein